MSPQGATLPGNDSMIRMIRLWANGSRTPSRMYADLLGRVLGVRFEGTDDRCVDAEAPALREALDTCGSVVDSDMIDALAAQTDSLRTLDRRLGAARLLVQVEAHLATMSELVTFAPVGPLRRGLAGVAAETAALAGWQALDLGKPRRSWTLHQQGRSLALESADQAVIGHVTAQAGYAMLDAGRPAEGLARIRAARRATAQRAPALMRSWLWAAEGEAHSACGQADDARRCLDRAGEVLGRDEGESLPYLALDSNHLARWRGHCLARVGDSEAIEDLRTALAGIDPSFKRAAAGLHVDLAIAQTQRGERNESKHHADKAAHLSMATGSARQRRRIVQLLQAQGEQVE